MLRTATYCCASLGLGLCAYALERCGIDPIELLVRARSVVAQAMGESPCIEECPGCDEGPFDA